MRAIAAVASVVVLTGSAFVEVAGAGHLPECLNRKPTIVGTNENDRPLRGTSGDDVIAGLGGHDLIYGGGGNDLICGGYGNDQLVGDDGNDNLRGEAGTDHSYGGEGNDTLGDRDPWDLDCCLAHTWDVYYGNNGSDTIVYSDRSSQVRVTLDDVANDGQANEGDNVHSSIENIIGGWGDDVLMGSARDNYISGGSDGGDRLYGEAGNDVIVDRNTLPQTDRVFGGDGTDNLDVSQSWGPTYIGGGSGTDAVSYATRTAPLRVTTGDALANDGQAGEGDHVEASIEWVTGGTGNDALTGSNSPNRLNGGAGNDTLNGQGGADQLRGDAGDDMLTGRAGNDSLVGGDGRDRLIAGNGNDTVSGGNGNDSINIADGVSGNDSADGGFGTDTAAADPGDALVNIP
jgi:Ca2+-binding RTX toxin-like protein